MPKSFDASGAPFDRLSPQETENLRAAIDIVYFRPDETIIAQDGEPAGLFVVIKGCVEERDGAELIGLRGLKDVFDSRALVQGGGSNAFVAREETLCYLLPRAVVLELINANPRFGAFFFLDISRKLDAVAQDVETAHIGATMNARVGDLFLHKACVIDANDSIAHAGQKMQETDCNALFVRDGERVGVVTGMNLSKACVLKRMSVDTPVASISQFDVISVMKEDFVSHALLLMTKHNKRRLAVVQDREYVGFLEDIDLLSFLAGNAQLVAGRIDRAPSLAELGAAAPEISAQVRMLRRQGVKIETVCEIISDLNRHLFAKLFAMTAPDEIRAKGCLIVMGSEGRGEQTVRTDQDNGLILAEPVDAAALEKFRQDFSGALERFGFPPCPGGVMVNNPLWSRTLDEYRRDFAVWTHRPDEHAHMSVAIFYDADAVAGDPSLLRKAKTALVRGLADERAFMGRFARAVDAFDTPIGLFNNLKTSEGDGDALDLKKGGIFPIVHGVRALAIERGLEETNTLKRLARLAELDVLKTEFARDLTQSLNYLMTLRLDAQLAALASGSLLRPSGLSTLERDLLRDSFHVVKQLREIVRRHFNTGAF